MEISARQEVVNQTLHILILLVLQAQLLILGNLKQVVLSELFIEDLLELFDLFLGVLLGGILLVGKLVV